MANDLIFPIGFDLEAGIKTAEKNADVALRRLEAALNRKPLSVAVTMDASKFSMFERQFSNSIDGIQAKLAQAQRLWNSMSFDVKFDEHGNLSRRAQIVFDAFNQLTQASATMGQRLGEVNRRLSQSEAETARLITAEYDKRKRQIDEQIRLKERQAAAEERARQTQLKGVNVGYVDLQKQTEAVRNLRLQYEAILPTLNAMAQKRVDIKVRIDKQFEADVNRINAEIARLRQSNLQLGAKGDTNAIQANLAAIRQLEAELQRISQQKIDLLNTNKINSDLSRLRTEIASVFGELQAAERKLASDNSLNAALDAQSKKVLNLHAQIQKLDQQVAQLNAQGNMYNADGSFSSQATTLLQQRIALTKQLEQAAVTGQQAQIKLEQQLREEKRRTDQEAKQAAKEAERQAKAEAAARKQAIEAANAENKARQAAYNARRKQGLETQRILQKEAKSIADITAQLQIQQQRLNNADIGSTKFNKIAEEVKRLTAELDKANQKMRQLTTQTTSGAARQVNAVTRVNNEFKNQDGYVSRLIKRLAVYAGFQQITGFLASVREVTAEFELQRISLGAIIQDQAKANQLFSEIKSFALKSPVKILDLTKYTKQLAAYKIGTDELFDTTKRLADISVGLGVSMDRIILMYGQIRATGYLRASEVRQATEAGIPLVEELAKKLSAANGELVRASDVMDMISKREIPFELVKEVFEDMTSAGGTFYNMQEKQGNTLYGMWQKLGDAAAMMYDEIGNTESVNSLMKSMIETLRDMMRHWKQVGIAVAAVAVIFGKAALSVQSIRFATERSSAANMRYIASLKARMAAAQRLMRMQGSANVIQRMSMRSTLAATKANYAAAMSNNVLTRSFYKLKAAMLSNPWTAILTVIAAIVVEVISLWQASGKLTEELSQIEEEYGRNAQKAKDRFVELAELATKSANGSREQKEALGELNRTYGDVLGSERLEIDNLRELHGQYGELIDIIDAYNLKKKHDARETSINTYYDEQLKDEYDAILEALESEGLSPEKASEAAEKFSQALRDGLSYDEAKAELKEFVEKEVPDKVKLLNNTLGSIGLPFFFRKGPTMWHELWNGFETPTRTYATLLEQQNAALDANAKSYSAAVLEANKYQAAVEDLAKTLESHDFGGKGALVPDLSDDPKVKYYAPQDLEGFDAEMEEVNAKLAAVLGKTVSILYEEGVAIQDGWFEIAGSVKDGAASITNIDFDAILAQPISDKAKAAIRQIREMAENYAPLTETQRAWQTNLRKIVSDMGYDMTDFRKYLIQGGDDLKAYRKKISEELDHVNELMKQNLANQARYKAFGWAIDGLLGDYKKLEDSSKVLTKLLSDMPSFEAGKRSGRTASDNRLSQLREIEQTLTTINSKYEELLKKEGQTMALADIQEIYGNTLKYINKLGGKFKLNFAMPTEFATLQEYRKAIQDVIEKLKMKGYEKAALELQTKIDTGDVDKLGKELEAKIKQLADRISRTKAAREFYDKILSQTGDIELAATLSVAVHGEDGKALKQQIIDNIDQVLKSGTKGKGIDFSAAIRSDGSVDYDELMRIVDAYKAVNEIGEDAYNKIAKMRDEDRKDLAKTVEGWLKATEKAKSYSDKMISLAQTTNTEIARINAEKKHTQEDINRLLGLPDTAENRAAIEALRATLAEYDTLIQGFQAKQKQEEVKLGYEAFKDSPMYVQMFDDLDNASAQMLENMKARITALQTAWKDLDPTQLKELQSRLNEIDRQLVSRNPFTGLIKGIKDYRKLMKDGDGSPNNSKSKGEAEQYLMDMSKRSDVANKSFNAALKKYAVGTETFEELMARYEKQQMKLPQDLADAKEELDEAMRDERAAQKAVENWKKVEKAIELSAKELSQMLDFGGDIAQAIADVSEVMGADKEDVQYWNDIASALNQISGGIQDIVNSAMSGNVVGIISSVLTAAPKMFGGFINLFSAGKVRKANKEIKRQQEILEQLQYSYSRLEASADKLFGSDYINNYNTQLNNLRAQAAAYQKQADAERSKGKKKDKERIKEYENAYRDTMDKIEDMQGRLAEQMTGTDVASAARDFAQAWLEAYASFGNSTDAIKEKFDDMIKNMIVNSVMAKVAQTVLDPLFKDIDRMYKDGASMETVIAYTFRQSEAKARELNNAMLVNAKLLESLGVNIRELYGSSSDLKGTSRQIASASKEDINSLAAGINTQNYYMSQINANVAMIAAHMGATAPAVSGIDYSALMQQSVDRLAMIERYSSEILTECRRSAAAAESTLAEIRHVIVPKQGSATHYVAVRM